MGAPVRLGTAHGHAGRAGAIAHSRRIAAMAAAAVVAGVLLAGCTGGGAPPPATPPATPTAPSTSTAPEPPPSGMADAAPSATYVPPDMAWLPPEDEVDRLVGQAEQAYRAHWSSYDAAIRTGFADPDLLETLLASAAEATLEALYLQVAAIGDTGRFVEGGSEVLGMAHVGMDPPTTDGEPPGIVFDTCVHTRATLKEHDGTTVRELSAPEPNFLRVQLVARAGAWLVTSQTQHGEPCPELLAARR